jgi:hypothetical protein
MEQNLDKNQATEPNFDPMEEGGIKYHMKNVEGEPRTSIRDVIHMCCNAPSEHAQLDAEKAAYLFDPEEIAEINKDLEELTKKPYGNTVSNEEYEFLEEKGQALEDVLMNGVEKEVTSSLDISIHRFKRNGEDYLSIKEAKDGKAVERDRKEIKDIHNNLVNQKSLSKIWVIDEKFGIEEDHNLTEEKAFNKAIKYPMEPKDSDFYKYRKYDPSSEKYTIICPLCKNEKSINIIFSIKCPRCNGVGYIKITTDKYDSLVKKRIQKLKKLEQNKPKFRSLVLEDKRTINF